MNKAGKHCSDNLVSSSVSGRCYLQNGHKKVFSQAALWRLLDTSWSAVLKSELVDAGGVQSNELLLAGVNVLEFVLLCSLQKTVGTFSRDCLLGVCMSPKYVDKKKMMIISVA